MKRYMPNRFSLLVLFHQFISAYFLNTFIDTRDFLLFPYYRSQRQAIVATLLHTTRH